MRDIKKSESKKKRSSICERGVAQVKLKRGDMSGTREGIERENVTILLLL